MNIYLALERSQKFQNQNQSYNVFQSTGVPEDYPLSECEHTADQG